MNKDKVTNICGIVALVAGTLIAADKAGEVQLGPAIDGVLTIVMTIAGSVVAYFTGKTNPVK